MAGWAAAANIISAAAGHQWQNYWHKSSAKYARKMQERQHDFQERMSNTQWQRGVKDMRAAGINPLLAVSQGPASSPAGGSGSGPGVPSAKQLDFAQLALLNAQKENIESSTGKNIAMKDAMAGAAEVGKLLGELVQGLKGENSGKTVVDKTRATTTDLMEFLDVGGFKKSRANSALADSVRRNREESDLAQRIGRKQAEIAAARAKDKDTKQLYKELRDLKRLRMLQKDPK